jgi:hypothetical protein
MWYEFLLLAKKSAEVPSGPTGPSMPVCWFIVGFMTILGRIVTLTPTKRTIEFKKPQDE